MALFGSRVRGEYLPYSDYDVLVVLNKVSGRFKVIKELRHLKPLGINLDLLVLSTKDLKDKIIIEMLKSVRILLCAKIKITLKLSTM